MSRQQILDSQVSFYKNHSDTAGEIRSLLGLCEDIKHGKWDRDILAMRQELEGVTDEKERDRIKKIHKAKLSAFTGSGVFSERNAKGLTKHSGVLFIDFDPKENPILLEKFDEIRKQLTADKYTYILFTSCSGRGIAVGVKIDGTKHVETFKYLEQYYKKEYGLTIDKACKDVTRLRYISSDPDLYYANGSTQLVIILEGFLKESERGDTKPIPNANGKNHEIIRAIIASKILLGDDSYDSWLKIAFALVQEFGETGREYFHELSKISPKYDPVDCDRKFDNCIKTNKGDVTFATIVHMARVAGVVLNNASVGEVGVSPEKIIQICEFPIDVFPDEFKRLVNKVATSIDISHEAVASIALTILSSCIGNTVKVSPKKDFCIAPFLWTAVVLQTGAGKSPTKELLVKPIKKMQSQAYLRHKELMQEYEVKLNVFKKDKSGTTEQPEVPKMDQFYISDSTVEAMADVFEDQPRGILNYQDELSGLILGLDQYKGKGNDKQHYLDLFNCNSWKIDRKGKSRFIPSIGMGIIGGIQPMVLTQVFGDDSFHDGFIQRFLFVCPESRPLRFSRESVSDEELTYWEDLLYWCFGIPLEMNDSGFVKSKILTLSDGTLNLWEKFFNEYGQLMTILPTKVSGFIPKLHLYSLKLAGVLHIVDSFNKKHILPVISEKTIQDAISLVEYYFGQVGKMLSLYGKKEKIKEYHKRIINIIHTLQSDVTNGKLKMSKIVEGYNKDLPSHAHLTSEKMSNILNKELGLTAKESTGGYSYLFWECEKIENLFRVTVTTPTTSTQKPKGEVGVDSESKNEPAFWESDNSDFDVETDILEVVK